MSKSEQILEAAEAVLYREGFHASGVDRLVAAAGVTPRTLYRHFRSKDDLVRAVLERREARYLAWLEQGVARHTERHGDPLLAVFDALGEWLAAESDQGCIFLKALGEYGAHQPAIGRFAVAHKQRMLAWLRARVAESGLDPAGGLPERLALLMEGATALAPVLGPGPACDEARAAAGLLRTAQAEVQS